MKTVSDIIIELGGITKVARTLGIPATTVSAWKSRGSIPASYWAKLIELSKSDAMLTALMQAHTSLRS